MRCAWNALLSIIPDKIRRQINQIPQGALQEIRLRINAPPEIIVNGEGQWISETIGKEDLQFVLNAASQYSPWAAATSSKGYITAPGGHRIGICGEVVMKNDCISGFSQITSLCIRIANDVYGIGRMAQAIQEPVLILGAPGWGKTTLLRDWIRQLSERHTVCVIDERKELFPDGFIRGKRMDILYGCPKKNGIEMGVRTMNPDWIAVDEITAEEDCMALIHAANCGIHLVATAHASSIGEFENRNVYRMLLENHIFELFAVLNKNKTYKLERANI